MSTCLCTSLSDYPPRASRKSGCQLQIEKWKQQRFRGAGYAVRRRSWLNSRKCDVKAQCDLFLSLQKLFFSNCSVANINREWGAGAGRLLCWWSFTGFCSQTLGPHACLGGLDRVKALFLWLFPWADTLSVRACVQCAWQLAPYRPVVQVLKMALACLVVPATGVRSKDFHRSWDSTGCCFPP